ncbi:hypothetical protein BBJ28_00009987 [Nothophytophthora sp. Chile5]|nr:hypothetical protein BBJ28_00009987 [Nothophytophthora sp. Chile5]
MAPPAEQQRRADAARDGVDAIDALLHTSPDTAVEASAQSNAASAASGPPEMAAAAREEDSASTSDDGETDEMVEALEDLILEAYNSMQSDGEYIFLPDEVAEKLHRVAEQMKLEDERMAHEEEQAKENAVISNAGEDSGSGDTAVGKQPVEATVEMKERYAAPEPEQEQEQDEGQTEWEYIEDDEDARLRKVLALQAEAAELREEKHKQRLPRVLSTENLFTELAPVPEIDEEASSGPPSPSPPHSRSHSAATTPQLRPQTPARGPSHFPPPPLISLSSTPSSLAASPDFVGKSPASRTPDHSGGSHHGANALTYEKRREAALKLKEDKKRRELRIRESARKQRDDAKRQLEEVHQKDMEEKRERVRRIREERLHRRAGKSAAKGAK